MSTTAPRDLTRVSAQVIRDYACGPHGWTLFLISDMSETKEKRSMANERPAFTKRLNNVRVTVWANQTDGQFWFSTVFTRRFKDGDKWRDVTTFNGLGDLALLKEAAELACDFIRGREAEQTESEPQTE
jgi:hypothetical protein